jgi:hypothetical protein
MSTVRIQVRRGTASQWDSIDPVLEAGEIGFESDTNKFKFGNGDDAWSLLTYAAPGYTDFQNTLDDYLAVGLRGTANGVASLNSSGKVPASELDITELSQDAVNTAITAGTGITKTYDDNANTITVAVDTSTIQARVANVSDTEIGYLDGVTSAIQTQFTGKAPVYSPTFTGTPEAPTATVGTNTTQIATTAFVKSEVDALINGAPGALNTLDELAAALGDDANYASTITTALSGKLSLSGGTMTGDLSLSGSPTSNAHAATKLYVDGVASTASGNFDAHTGSTTSVHGIADTSVLETTNGAQSKADAAKTAAETTASGYVSTHSSDTTNIHGIADTSVLVTSTQLGLKQDIVENVSNTEIGYLDGVTSSIQTQLNAKLASTTAATTYAPIASPAFTGTVSGVTKSHVGLSDVDNTADSAKPVSSATQTALDLKSNIAGPTFTGTVTVPTLAVTTTATGITSAMVGLGSVDNTADADKPVSTAAQTALDLKAPKADPTFTGTVVLPSTTSVGDVSATELGYVNGVTSAIQTQLDDKLSKTGGTMTGALTLSADPSASLHAATKQYVDNTASGVVAKPQVLGATALNIDATYSNGTAGVGATLTHNTNGVFPADAGGASGWAVGKGILVKNQTNKAQNGRYYISNMGSVSTPYVLTRCTYCDEASEIPGAYIFVQDGTFAGTGWIQVVADPATFVVGTDNIDVFQFSGSGTITAGTGITVSGNEVSISTGAITSSLILDGTIVNEDINASAAIAQSKISGLTSDLAAKAPLADPTFTGTVTVAASGVAFTDGTQTKEGVASRTPIVQKTASYTLSSLSERDSLIEVSSASATTITIPLNSAIAYPVGTSIDILQTSTGQVTVAGDAGVTVNATPGLKLRTQWSSATLFKRATNTWVVIGDLSA